MKQEPSKKNRKILTREEWRDKVYEAMKRGDMMTMRSLLGKCSQKMNDKK